MLIWYSQEGRAYALLVLLAAISLLYFMRAARGEEADARRNATLWGVFSALALATHYFAFFPVAVEAGWLLWRRRRAALPGVAILAGLAIALVPLLVHQVSFEHAEWIGNFTLGHRFAETGFGFALGETGDVISQAIHPLWALVPALLAGLGLALLAVRSDRAERRAVALPLAIAAATILAPLVLALLDPGRDFVFPRNLLPALVPLLLVLAIGLSLRRARRLGTALAALLAVYWLGFSIYAGVSPALQRPDWEAVADELGEPSAPRAMVTWTIGEAPLRYYLSTGSIQVRAGERFRWWVGELDFISDGAAPPPPPDVLGPGFREAGYRRAGRFYIRRFVTSGPELVRLRLREARRAELGFRSNGVLLDGVSP